MRVGAFAYKGRVGDRAAEGLGQGGRELGPERVPAPLEGRYRAGLTRADADRASGSGPGRDRARARARARRAPADTRDRSPGSPLACSRSAATSRIEDALDGADAPRAPCVEPRGEAARAASAPRASRGPSRRASGSTASRRASAATRSTASRRADAAALQENLLVCHAFGAGEPFPDEVVRLALAPAHRTRSRAATRASGPRRVEALMRLVEADVLAVVPAPGQRRRERRPLPALVPRAPAARPRPRARGGREMDARAALRRAGLAPDHAAHKEGLALVNGTQVTLACALLALERGVDGAADGRRRGGAHDGGAGGTLGRARRRASTRRAATRADRAARRASAAILAGQPPRRRARSSRSRASARRRRTPTASAARRRSTAPRPTGSPTPTRSSRARSTPRPTTRWSSATTSSRAATSTPSRSRSPPTT